MPQATGRPTPLCPLLSPHYPLSPLQLLCLLVNLMGFPLKTCSHALPSAVGWIEFRPSCAAFSHGPMRNAGFLGHACPQRFQGLFPTFVFWSFRQKRSGTVYHQCGEKANCPAIFENELRCGT